MRFFDHLFATLGRLYRCNSKFSAYNKGYRPAACCSHFTPLSNQCPLSNNGYTNGYKPAAWCSQRTPLSNQCPRSNNHTRNQAPAWCSVLGLYMQPIQHRQARCTPKSLTRSLV